MNTYHKHAKEWAVNGAIMEDIITNFELKTTRLLRMCPCCGTLRTSSTTCDGAEDLGGALSEVRFQAPR